MNYLYKISLIFFCVFTVSLLVLCTPFKNKSDFSPEGQWEFVLKLVDGKKFEQAINELENYLSDYSDEPRTQDARFLLCYLYLKEKKYEEVKELCLQLYSDSYFILRDYLLYFLTKAYFNLGDYQKTEDTLDELVKTYPASIWNARALVALGNLRFNLERYEEASLTFEKVLREDRWGVNIPRMKHRLAMAYLKNDNLKGAARLLLELWQKYPDSIYSTKAYEIIRQYTIDRLYPETVWEEEILKRTSGLINIGSYSSAIAELDRLREVLPNNDKLSWRVNFQTSKCYYHKRNLSRAKDLFTSLKEEAKDEQDLLLASFWLGKTLMKMGNKSDARKEFMGITGDERSYPVVSQAMYKVALSYANDRVYSWSRGLYGKLIDDFPDSPLREEILWKIGFFSYLEGDYGSAHDIFKGMIEEFIHSPNFPRYLYWNAKVLKLTGKEEEALNLYRLIMESYPFTYPGYLIVERASKEEALRDLLESFPSSSSSAESRCDVIFPMVRDEENVFEVPMTLINLTLYDFAVNELIRIQKKFWRSPNTVQRASMYLMELNKYNNAMWKVRSFLGRRIWNLEVYCPLSWRLAYPRGYNVYVDHYSDSFAVDPLLVFALIREESSFNPGIKSSAGARGLMQIIPSTGKHIAGTLNLNDYHVDMLFEPGHNINMGISYLKDLLDSYDGKHALALAAYNGGPSAVNKWLKRIKYDDIDEFIEQIPYYETRRYVKKVLRSYHVYRWLYGVGEEEREDEWANIEY